MVREPAPAQPMEEDHYRAAEGRIELRTPLIGLVGAVIVAFAMGKRPGAAVLAGTFLSWLNFRLLRQVVGTLANLAIGQTDEEQSGEAAAREKANAVPRGSYVKIFGLLVLLLLSAYVMLAVFKLPILPLLGGLLAVVPAILLELVSELTHGGRAPGHT